MQNKEKDKQATAGLEYCCIGDMVKPLMDGRVP